MVSDFFVRLYLLSGVTHTDESTAGLFGATPLALGGGSVADLFAEKDRASAMAL